ncbi:dehydrogenase [Rhodoferax koreense]|uniref:Dehydrogenase n=1 Tax=Rhodoferax koreensis TaxID=1842727 RepID=A0A1P8JU56_9BURK|nr:NAD(P)H-dependent oxidoreductase [Rhodoferax koreense]APW37265.1 dehydrogenase [Rhodoferax koreense]
MTKHIVILQGHPDTEGSHFCHGLAMSYADGARAAGHAVELFEVGAMDFPLLRKKSEWDSGEVLPQLARVRAAIEAADQLVVVFPLWLGDMPAVLKAFFEQVLRPGQGGTTPPTRGRRCAARVVVTMGMPATLYRWYFWAHSLRSLRRNLFGFVGIKPVRITLVGSIEAIGPARRGRWLAHLHALGRAAG